MSRKQMALSVFLVFLLSSLASPAVMAQEVAQEKVADLEARVQVLEKYVEQINANLDSFSKDLFKQVDMKVKSDTDKVVTLNPVSKAFTKIETNSGMFLIAVTKFQRIEKGYRLLLNIGNPNAAKYTGMRFNLHWGKKWDASYVNTKYDAWRASLMSGEFTYGGELLPGQWTEVTIDLTPAGANQLEYIECEMQMDTVQLQK